MKYLLTALLALCTISLWSCADSQQKESETQPKPQDLVEIKDGHYKEWYPSKKQVKYEGMLNKNGDREGKWNFYTEKGNLRSFTFYNAHKKKWIFSRKILQWENSLLWRISRRPNGRGVGYLQ